MRFKLRQMEVFRAVMATGSMSGAARLLNVTQPAISRIIQHTESSLGLLLFERRLGRLEPTAEALRLIPEVESLYEGARKIDSLARDLSRKSGGSLTIAASPSLALHVIPQVIARYMAAHPQVHIRYYTALLSAMPAELASRRADLAISVLPVEEAGLVCEGLADGEMVCLMPNGHLLAAQDGPLGLAEIATHPLVMYDLAIPFGVMIGAAFEAAGVEPSIAMEVPRAELAIAMVRAGIGLAIVDEFAVAGLQDPALTVRPIREAIGVTLSVITPRLPAPGGQNQRSFIALLRSELRRPGGRRG